MPDLIVLSARTAMSGAWASIALDFDPATWTEAQLRSRSPGIDDRHTTLFQCQRVIRDCSGGSDGGAFPDHFREARRRSVDSHHGATADGTPGRAPKQGVGILWLLPNRQLGEAQSAFADCEPSAILDTLPAHSAAFRDSTSDARDPAAPGRPHGRNRRRRAPAALYR